MFRISLILCSLISCVLTNAQFSYTETAQLLGITHQSRNSNYGGAVSVSDFDGDGWDDITLGSGLGDSIQFYKNNAGQGFQRVYFGPDETLFTKQILWADYDNDGDQDLFVANFAGQNNLYENIGGNNLVNVNIAAGIPSLEDPTWAAAWGDYDRDGYLDLMVTNFVYASAYSGLFQDYLLKNNGDGTFRMLTTEVNIPAFDHAALVVSFMDYNNDLWPDIFIASDKNPSNRLLRNNGFGSFDDVTIVAGVGQQIDAMSAGIGDYDNNGYLDIYCTNSPFLSPGGSILVQNNGNGTFSERSTQAGVDFNGEGWAANFIDFDNDSDLDLYVSGSISNGTTSGISNTAAMFDNQGNGTFIELISGIGMQEDTKSSYAHAIGDFNKDGFADIIVNNRIPDTTQLWMHNGGINNWIDIKLQGTVSNRDGIGTWIKLFCTGAKEQVRYTHHALGFMGQNTMDGHFGLDSLSAIDSIKIIWPSGHEDLLINISVNQRLLVIEGVTAPVKGRIASIGNPQVCQGGQLQLYTLGVFDHYLWSTGDTSASIIVTNSGTYGVTMTDANNNISFDSIQVLVAPPVVSNVSLSDVSCFGDANGLATTSTIGGNGLYNYLWSTGSTTQHLNNLGPGNYALTITDGLGCFDTLSFLISEPTALQLSSIGTNISCYGDSSGAVNLSVFGGTPPYVYNWSNSSTNQDLSGLSHGIYSVYVQDSMGCSDMETTIIISPSSPLQTTILKSDTLCYASSNGFFDLEVSGGTAPYTYLWSNMQTTQDINNLVSGIYSVEVVDDNGCKVIFSDTLSEYSALNISTNLVTDSISQLATINVNVSGGQAPYTFLWSNGQSTAFVSGLSLGDYTLTVVDAQACTDTIILTVSAFTGFYKPSQMDISVFPNPADGFVDIDFGQLKKQAFSIQLSDALGRILYAAPCPAGIQSKRIYLNTLEPGYYWISLLGNTGVILTSNIQVE